MVTIEWHACFGGPSTKYLCSKGDVGAGVILNVYAYCLKGSKLIFYAYVLYGEPPKTQIKTR